MAARIGERKIAAHTQRLLNSKAQRKSGQKNNDVHNRTMKTLSAHRGLSRWPQGPGKDLPDLGMYDV